MGRGWGALGIFLALPILQHWCRDVCLPTQVELLINRNLQKCLWGQDPRHHLPQNLWYREAWVFHNRKNVTAFPVARPEVCARGCRWRALVSPSSTQSLAEPSFLRKINKQTKNEISLVGTIGFYYHQAEEEERKYYHREFLCSDGNKTPWLFLPVSEAPCSSSATEGSLTGLGRLSE